MARNSNFVLRTSLWLTGQHIIHVFCERGAAFVYIVAVGEHTIRLEVPGHRAAATTEVTSILLGGGGLYVLGS